MVSGTATHHGALRSRAALAGQRAREALQGYLFISPWIIGFIAFTLGPMISSVYYSLTDYSVSKAPVFVGLENYITAVSVDPLFWQSIGKTAIWAVATVPTGIIGSLIAAVLLNQGLKGNSVYRTCFFLPSLVPVVAAALLWKWMFHPNVGVINYALSILGMKGPGWLTSTKWALWALVIVALWTGIGGSRMIIFLAGLQGIPKELYEAASIDGAGSFRRHLHITVPLITPAIFFNLIMGLIGSFRSFDLAFLTTEGGPAYSTYFLALHIYYKAFMYFEMGYASALSWFLFIIVILLTIAQFATSGEWVFYESAR